MGALTKALRHSEAMADTAHRNAIQVKAAGLDIGMGGSDLGGIGSFTNRASNNERYGLFRGVTYAAIHAIALEGSGQPVNMGVIKKPAKRKSRVGTKHILNKMLPAARLAVALPSR